MADKTIDQLTELTTLEANDLLIAYDVSELGTEKIRKITKTNAFVGVGGGEVTTAQLLTTSGTLQSQFDGLDADFATGEIAQFMMSTMPDGWLQLLGTNVSRTTYADLFAKIGTTYGAGDGSTTFTLPTLLSFLALFGAGTSLPAVRYDHTASVLSDGRILVTGGYDGAAVRAETYFGTIARWGIRT